MNMNSILLLNGPNLDMLGTREPGVYGSQTLADLEGMVAAYAAQRGIAVSRFQSNSEGDLINVLHAAPQQFDGIIYNPGAHTHYSYALRDAVAGIQVPVVEVHISDVDNREAFRRVSVIAPACIAQVKGLGFDGYCKAVDILCEAGELVRLGEGYEALFPQGEHVLVASAKQVPAPEVPDKADDATVSVAASSDVTAAAANGAAGRDEADDSAFPDDEDFAAPYADDVAAVDLAAVSQARLKSVRDACRALGVHAFVVRDTPAIQWLTALDGVFDEERAHALVITENDAVLHTDSRYSGAVRTRVGQIGSALRVNDDRVGHMSFAADALRAPDGSIAGKMLFEDTISYAEYVKAVEAVGIGSLVASSDVVVGLRGVKSNGELSRMLAAQAVTDAAFVHIVKFMRPGMTEREVQIELEDYMVKHGAEGLAFRSIVATGPNGADPHAVPGATRLEAGQCVVMDFGAKAYGYCADMTRMVFLGTPDQRLADAWQVLRRANEEVEAFLAPGVTGKQAHELAERILAEGGYAGKMGHGLGHGVGIEVHEQPVLNLRNEKSLVVGNVVTVEPGIYLPGDFGMRLEDCGVITPNGYEVFSQLGHEMVVI